MVGQANIINAERGLSLQTTSLMLLLVAQLLMCRNATDAVSMDIDLKRIVGLDLRERGVSGRCIGCRLSKRVGVFVMLMIYAWGMNINSERTELVLI